jgi:hypothetical protein
LGRPALEQIGNISLCHHHQLTTTTPKYICEKKKKLFLFLEGETDWSNLIFKTRAQAAAAATAAASPSL